ERYADEVHISFEDSKKYLRRKEKTILTGNPVRKNLGTENKVTALQKFGLIQDSKTLLVLGGSLGAASINNAVVNNIARLEQSGIQVIWQTGANYFDDHQKYTSKSVKVYEFIDDMNAAYSACDLLLARAGATTIAEILVLGVPSILVPSPNVAENHQYYNAKSLSDNNAAVLLKDDELNSGFSESVISIIESKDKLNELKSNAVKLAKPDAAKNIAINALKYMEAV
ncbi:MAG: glycosyltransferase, partial [Ignavibacteriaceae bacterium]